MEKPDRPVARARPNHVTTTTKIKTFPKRSAKYDRWIRAQVRCPCYGGKLIAHHPTDHTGQAEVKALRGANADAVVAKLNPIITGWAAYYRIGVSKRAFAALDAHLWRLVYKWARFSHPNKSVRWVLARYFGMFHPARQDKWVFGSRDSGFYLRKFAWTPIIRHRMVAGTASPDDSSLTDYWAQRRRRNQPPIGTTTLRLLRIQHGRCPLCQGLLLHADREPQSPREWEQWLTATRTAIRKHAITIRAADTPDERIADRLIHAHCRRRITDTNGKPTTPAHREPTELA